VLNRLAAAARDRGLSVAAAIRNAIEAARPADVANNDVAQKQRAASAVLAAEPMPIPETVEELKAELEETRTVVLDTTSDFDRS
jgi:hypothetical protein